MVRAKLRAVMAARRRLKSPSCSSVVMSWKTSPMVSPLIRCCRRVFWKSLGRTSQLAVGTATTSHPSLQGRNDTSLGKYRQSVT